MGSTSLQSRAFIVRGYWTSSHGSKWSLCSNSSSGITAMATTDLQIVQLQLPSWGMSASLHCVQECFVFYVFFFLGLSVEAIKAGSGGDASSPISQSRRRADVWRFCVLMSLQVVHIKLSDTAYVNLSLNSTNSSLATVWSIFCSKKNTHNQLERKVVIELMIVAKNEENWKKNFLLIFHPSYNIF